MTVGSRCRHDNAGTTHRMWTFDGTVPGPLVVRQGDVVNFTSSTTLPTNRVIDGFHAAGRTC